MKQDRQGVRTPSDIEQKYGLGQFMYDQGKTNSGFERNLTNLGDSLSLYKEATNNHLTELDDEYEALNKSHAELQKKTTNKLVQNEKSIKANASAVKALSLEVDKNTSAIKENETNLANLQSDFDSSLWYAVFALTADQTIATASTFQTLPLKAISARGSFLTLSSDGKKITFTKKMVVTISAQLYFSTGYSVDQQAMTRINLNGSAWLSGRGRCDTANPYMTVPLTNRAAIVNAGDYIELQAYTSGSGGLLGSGSSYSWLTIDVKGVIE